jgi:hypothetical protein
MTDLPPTTTISLLPARDAASPRRFVRLVGLVGLVRLVELLALFGLLPLLVRWRVVEAPRLLVLAVVTASCVVVLWRDPTFDRRRLFSLHGVRASLKTTALRGVVAALMVIGLAAVLTPSSGALPRDMTLWLAGLALYPFLSAWPQEVVYRVFFFHRYGALFGSEAARLAANALAFGALHLIYPNLVAPLLSMPAGLLLALTYRRTESMGPVWLEHTLYGLLLFSLGLGGFFFDGRP